ncbi:hypothetical protein AYI68_g6705, partial [Smittium mucronatum]
MQKKAGILSWEPSWGTGTDNGTDT